MKKLKLLLYSILFFLCPLLTSGQSWLWARQALGKPSEEGITVTTDKNGNVYLLGYYTPLPGQYMVIGNDTLRTNANAAGFLAKYDSTGNFLWAAQSNGYSIPSSIVTDGNSNTYETGYFSDTTLFDNHMLYSKHYNIYLVKYNPNGHAIWASAPKNKSGNIDQGNSVAIDTNNDIYVTGTFEDTAVFGANTIIGPRSSNSFLAKYDSNSNVIWVEAFDANSLSGNSAQEVTVDRNNCPIIVGSFGDPTISIGSYTLINSGHINTFVAKFNSSGTPLWAISEKGTNNDQGNSVTTDKDNNIYISGTYNSPNAIFGKDTLKTSNGPLFIAKYNTVGDEIWAKAGKSPFSGSTGWSMLTDSCDDIYISGDCGDSLKIDNSTLHVPSAGSDPAFIIELDSAGNYLEGLLTTTGGDDWNGIARTNNNDIYFGGDAEIDAFFGDSVYAIGQENAFVAKLKFGAPSCSKNTAGINSVETLSRKFSVFPNPFTTTTTVLLNTEGRYTLELDDLTGRKLRNIEFTGTQYELPAKGLAKGLYFIRIFDNENSLIGTTKIVVQ